MFRFLPQYFRIVFSFLIYMGRDNAFELAAVDDICAFQVLCGVKSTDKFCTRYAPADRDKLSSKTVINKDLSKAMKDAVESLGLPRINFSPKSLRSGYATHQVNCDVVWEAMTSRGGWSKTAFYIFENARGPLSTAVDSQGVVQGLGLDGLKGLLPVGHCRCPDEQSYELSRMGVTMAPEPQVVLRAERSQSRPSLE